MQPWLEYLFNNFTLGQLQAGYMGLESVAVPGDPRPQRLMDEKPVAGTRIPASTLEKFRDGIYTPRERSLDKLGKFYRRHVYRELRQAGANTSDARRYSSRALSKHFEMMQYIRDYKRYAQGIAQAKGIDLAAAVYSLNHSVHGLPYWEHYVTAESISLEETDPDIFDDMLDEFIL